MAPSSSKSMFEYPINLEWTIAEDRLKALKDSINNKFLESEKFIAFHSSDVQYSLIIYPNGYNEKRGKTWIFFNLELGNAKKIEADFTLSIKSAEWRHKYTFEKSVACGNSCCTVAELFDSRKKFIVDGKFTLKVEGILKIEISESKNGMNIFQSKKKTIKNFGDLWDAGFEDFTFVAEGKEIEVHKNVLACQSPVFATMFKSSKMKEAIESKVEIPDFPYEIVLKALKFCYEQINIANLTMSDSFLLLKFADKYDISVLHEYLEKYLSDNITVENVCEIANAADTGNAQNLRNKCIHFVTVCVALKTFVPNVELLDNNFMVTVFGNNFCRKTQTL